jgi:peroxisomal trans-2-enoyl-CoA reductase
MSATTPTTTTMSATTPTTTTMSATTQSVFREDLFRGKTALVTGGGTGIGLAITKELALTGCKVVIASRSHSKCKEAAEQVNQLIAQQKGSGSVIAGPSTSIRKEEEIKALVEFVIKQCGSLDLLVNNAGGQFLSPAEDISSRGFSAVLETNLLGTFLVCREAYTQYMQDNGGSIVNITLNSRNGFPLMAHSGAARAGVENLTRTLCTEWIESNVRINCVRPGIIWTDSGFENYGAAGDAFVERILPTLPAKRFGSAEEVSSAVTWLLSKGASYVTGTVLCVDGASAYTFIPLVDIEDKANLSVYGVLPRKARL